ncbi:MAG: domain containing protein [Bryobacterales bacterium]|nr:domain containing protein [Bryobacterales bacterium]
MAFRLTRHESIAAGISRVLHEELTAAIQNLQAGNSGVHEARKSIKKLRGMLRMLEPRLGNLAAQETAALGEVSRSLAAARDHAATDETLSALAARHTGAAETRSLGALRKKLAKRPAPALAALEPAIQELTLIRGRITEWPTMPDNFGPIMEGLRETYRRGRKALRAIEANPVPDAFHTLRKRVKDHWYQVRLLEALWTSEPREPQLKELQECLGDDQNLGVLEHNAVLVPTVQRMVESTRAAYRARALEIAADIYADKPGEHEARVRKLWADWHRTQDVARKAPATAHHRRHKAA